MVGFRSAKVRQGEHTFAERKATIAERKAIYSCHFQSDFNSLLITASLSH
jgi:hypothetical protein